MQGSKQNALGEGESQCMVLFHSCFLWSRKSFYFSIVNPDWQQLSSVSDRVVEAFSALPEDMHQGLNLGSSACKQGWLYPL